MNCNEAREHLLDLAPADAMRVTSSPVEEHVRGCPACATELESLRATMALLEEWQAPEVSPYFDSRLRARVREVAEERGLSWLDWLRRPAIAGALAILMVVGAIVFRSAPQHNGSKAPQNGNSPLVAQGTTQQPGTAVTDLKDLDQNLDMYANFDMLDEISSQNAETPQNP
jgi:anti-sigma factor RsiW